MNKELNYTKGEWRIHETKQGYFVSCQSVRNGSLSKDDAQLISASSDCYKGLKDALKEICRMCVEINPQHEDCTSCEEMERSRLPLLKAGGK